MGCEAIFPAAMCALAIACGDSPRESSHSSVPSAPSHLELTIAKQLSDKLGRVAKVSCSGVKCTADLGDTTLPITIAPAPDGSSWRVDGLLVRSSPIEAYLRDALIDLGTKQGVTCGPALRSVEPGARIECTLERGGKAFATIRADGSFTTEITLDPASAAARSQDVAPGSLIDRSGGSAKDDDDDDD